MQPKVSVIIPVYNTSSYLRQCLDSVLSQTLEELEVIVVDDASTDGSWDIVQQYAGRDTRVVAIRHDFNRRQGAARNTGLRRARGAYIGFVDSDDWLSGEMYERLYRIAEKGAYDIVACGIEYVDFSNPALSYRYSYDAVLEGCDAIISAVGGNERPLMVGPCNRLHRRELILDEPVWFPEGVLFEDNIFTLMVCHRARAVRVVPDACYFYRQHSSSTVHQAAKRLHCISMFETIRDCRRFFETTGLRQRIPDAERRILNGFCDYAKQLSTSYLNSLHGRGEALDDEFALAAAEADGFFDYLMACACQRDFSQAALQLEASRMGGDGVRNHLRYLFRAIKRSLATRVRATPFERPLRGGYRIARRVVGRSKCETPFRRAA